MTQSKPDTTDWQQPPYRTDALEADFEEVLRLNEDQDRSGARAFEHAIMAERRINQAKSAARSRLESWTEHPDERVQIALIRRANSSSTPWTGNDEPYLRDALLSRLLANANATGHVWTKALDRLEGSHLYPVWHSNIDGLEYPWDRLDEEARDDAPAYETPDARLDRLIPWIEAQDTVQPLLDLFHAFSSRRLYERIARHARPLGGCGLACGWSCEEIGIFCPTHTRGFHICAHPGAQSTRTVVSGVTDGTARTASTSVGGACRRAGRAGTRTSSSRPHCHGRRSGTAAWSANADGLLERGFRLRAQTDSR